MPYSLIDVEISSLVSRHKPGAKYFIYLQDPYNIYKEDEIEHFGEEASEVDLSRLFLSYMDLYAAVSSNPLIKEIIAKKDIDSFFEEINKDKNEKIQFLNLLDLDFTPVFEALNSLPDFSFTDNFIKNYVKGKIDFDAFLKHIRVIDKFEDKEYLKIDFSYDVEPNEVEKLVDKLFNEGYLSEFVCFASICLNSDFISQNRYQEKVAIAKYKLREPELLKEENQNSYIYYLMIFCKKNAKESYERLKHKFGDKICDFDVFGSLDNDDPFWVKVVIPQQHDFKKWLRFLGDNCEFFKEMSSFTEGEFEPIFVKEITYYPHHELTSEDVDPELAKLGVGYSIRFNLGKNK